jgi:hypothetical protein
MSTLSVARSAEDIAREEVQAILDFNFELALQLSVEKNQAQQEIADAEENHYWEQADRLMQENESDYNAQLERISATFQADSAKYRDTWKGLSDALGARQRDEARDLEEMWKEARDIERKRKSDAAELQLQTAKVLALCGKFKEAIETRTKANDLIADDNTRELREIDADFAERYRTLITRHEEEFKALVRHLRSLIEALENGAKGQETVAYAELQARNASNARMIIESVSQNSVSPVARDRVLQAFSPRPASRSPGSVSGKARSSTISSPVKN